MRLMGRVLAASALLLPLLPGGAAGAAAVRPAAAVQVSAAGPVRAVSPTLFGLNGVNTTGPLWNHPALDNALAGYAPGMLRYPGGTSANYWDWRAGWFQPGGSWPSEPSTPVNDKLGVFATAVGAAHTAPVFNLNVLTYSGAVGTSAQNAAMLTGQIQMLKEAAKHGMPVTMVELGNEFYLSSAHSTGPHAGEYARRFADGTDYADQINLWIARIHKNFPGAQVAAVATDTHEDPVVAPRRLNWNAQVLPALKGEDAVTMHELPRFGDASASPDSMLAEPYLHFAQLSAGDLALISSYHLPVWITAFGMTDTTSGHVIQGTWLHGLFTAEQALLYAGDPDIAHIGLSGGVGTAKDAAIYANSAGLGAGQPATVPLSLTAVGTTLAMIQSAFNRATSAQPAAFSPVPELGSTGAPALAGEDLSTPAGPELLLENLSSQPVTVDLSGIFAGTFGITQVSAASPQTLVTGPSSTTTSTSSGTGQVDIQPYAMADVTAG